MAGGGSPLHNEAFLIKANFAIHCATMGYFYIIVHALHILDFKNVYYNQDHEGRESFLTSVRNVKCVAMFSYSNLNSNSQRCRICQNFKIKIALSKWISWNMNFTEWVLYILNLRFVEKVGPNKWIIIIYYFLSRSFGIFCVATDSSSNSSRKRQRRIWRFSRH